MAMLVLLRRLDRGDITVHGFRSSFRDWAGEAGAFGFDVCEAALAHSKGDATVAAYFRSDLLEKRRLLMQSWAGYCFRPATSASVTEIGATK